MVDSKYYMTVLSQAFSPSGELLCAGDSFGKLAVIDRKNVLEGEQDDNYSFKAHQRSIQCLATTETHLLSADTVIHGWTWEKLKSRNTNQNFTITFPAKQFDAAEVNAMQVDENSSHLFAGCGDNLIYVFDLQTGQLLSTFKGHDDYVLALALRESMCISGSEDGSVRMWDTRQKKAAHKIIPSENTKLNRSRFGKWIGCLDATEDWLVCGGGPRLSLWHYRSMTLSAVLPPEDTPLNWTKMLGERIIAGGNKPILYQFNMEGQVLTQIPTSCTDIYSVALHDSPEQVMTIGGSGWKLDVCLNLNYKNHDIFFPD